MAFEWDSRVVRCNRVQRINVCPKGHQFAAHQNSLKDIAYMTISHQVARQLPNDYQSSIFQMWIQKMS
jgi:hypothetical protein